MGFIQKIKSGKFKAHYRDPSGAQRARTFERKTDANRFLTEVDSDKDSGRFIDPKLGKTQFEHWFDQWWETTLNLRPSTRDRDLTYSRSYILPHFGRMPLSNIAPLEVRKWVAALDAGGFAPATVKKAYQILSKIMRAAVDSGLIADSPCRGITLPRAEPEEMRFLLPEEVNRLANAIDSRYKALVLVAAYSGLRWGELAALTGDRFNSATGEIEVAETLVEVRGKVLPPGPPKTKAGRRTVKLPQSVAKELSLHMQTFRIGEEDFIFRSPEGGPLRKTFRQRFWLPAVSQAGLDPLRFHDLRHTAIAFWIAVGGNPKLIAVRAGHTSVSVVLDRYGHLFPEGQGELAEGLEVVFRKAASAKMIQRAPKQLPSGD